MGEQDLVEAVAVEVPREHAPCPAGHEVREVSAHVLAVVPPVRRAAEEVVGPVLVAVAARRHALEEVAGREAHLAERASVVRNGDPEFALERVDGAPPARIER